MQISDKSANHATAGAGARAPLPLVATDFLIYLVLVLLVWATWGISQLELFKPSDDTGYWVGVAGAVMMLLLFTYPLRKHFRFSRSWGNIKAWFVLHMVLGVLGPLLILLHSTFHIDSINAGVALYSMVIVAISGVVGRYLYVRINRGLHGEKTDLETLQRQAGLGNQEARSRLAFAPQVETWLNAFEQQEKDARDSVLDALRRVIVLPVQQIWLYWRCLRVLRPLLVKMAREQNWSDADLRRRRTRARKMVDRYLTAVVRVSQFSAFSRLFSLWHVAHIPFVYVLIATALVHVYAVHVY